MADEEAFLDEDGVLVHRRQPRHREDEYDEAGFPVLLRMQRDHFWYRGRHALIARVLERELAGRVAAGHALRAVDLGGGCGGWVEYLHGRTRQPFRELALADSSMRALRLAGPIVGSFAARYQVDLLDLPWSQEWDVAFLLDVIEHIPDHERVLQQVRQSLRPGGLLFVTTPALRFFWTYNDVLAHHQRRYSRRDFRVLANRLGFELPRVEYFMFFLSPLLLASRLVYRPGKAAGDVEIQEHQARTHATPPGLVNSLLTGVFSLEAALVDAVSFPWGTSILAVLRRPDEPSA
jgi:SAM-dependent methyltransferase